MSIIVVLDELEESWAGKEEAFDRGVEESLGAVSVEFKDGLSGVYFKQDGV
jgi:hypothetical protein